MLTDCFVELSVSIDWDYSPPQQQTRTDPSFDAELELTSVMHNGLELIDKLAPSALSYLKEQAQEHIESMDDRGNEP